MKKQNCSIADLVPTVFYSSYINYNDLERDDILEARGFKLLSIPGLVLHVWEPPFTSDSFTIVHIGSKTNINAPIVFGSFENAFEFLLDASKITDWTRDGDELKVDSKVIKKMKKLLKRHAKKVGNYARAF